MTNRPFYSGTQFGDWTEANCLRCTKGADPTSSKWPDCDIEAALVESYIGDGTVSDDIAARMGITEEIRGRYTWPCSEVVWTEEWKAEYRRGLTHPPQGEST